MKHFKKLNLEVSEHYERIFEAFKHGVLLPTISNNLAIFGIELI